jgi:hypothetical protein
MKSPRFWTVVVLLAGTALLLFARGNTDLIPASEPLSQFREHDCGMVGKRCRDRPGNARCSRGRRLPVARLHPGRTGRSRSASSSAISHSEDRRHHSFAEELPAGRRLGF